MCHALIWLVMFMYFEACPCPRCVIFFRTMNNSYLICTLNYGMFKRYLISSHCSGPPGTAEPYVTTVDIEDSFLYLMLISNGVYKSIEAAEVEGAQTIGANLVLANMVHRCAQTPGVEFSSIAQTTLDQVAHLHEEAFQRSAKDDVRSPKAMACRKRDDMTLVVYAFALGQPPKVCPHTHYLWSVSFIDVYIYNISTHIRGDPGYQGGEGGVGGGDFYSDFINVYYYYD